MLGDLIYEHKGKMTGQRVLDVSPPRVETSFSDIGTLKGGITVSEIGTYWSEARSPGILYVMSNNSTTVQLLRIMEMILYLGETMELLL